MFPFTFLLAPLPYSVQYIPQYSYVPPYLTQIHPMNYQQNPLNSNSYQEASKNSQNTSNLHKPKLLQQKYQTLHQFYHLNDKQSNNVMKQSLKVEQTNVKKIEVKQKFGRNIMSNIFHMMVRFVHKSKKMRLYIEKIIQTYNMSIKINEFYNMIKRKISKLPSYATQTIIKSFSNPNSSQNTTKNYKERQFSIIFRIISKIYLNTYHMPYVYNTKKIKPESKKLHQIYIRTFLEQ